MLQEVSTVENLSSNAVYFTSILFLLKKGSVADDFF